MAIFEKYRLFIRYFLKLLFDRKPLEDELEDMASGDFRRKVSYAKFIERKEGFPVIKALFCYQDPYVREIIAGMKYRGKRSYFRIASELFYEELIGELENLSLFSSFTSPLLIPTPLSPRRKRERSFNQSEMLLEGIRRIDQGRLFEARSDVLMKIRDTENQTKLSRQDRLKNLKGVFAVTDKKSIKNRNVILIDDVVTTGTTFSEIAKTLKRAGANKIICIAFAH